MGWVTNFLRSSIGRKLIMSLTGLFLCLFLVVHLAGNLALLFDDGGKSFNLYTYMMTNNPIIKFVSYGLYFFILLHAVQGILIAIYNRKSKGIKPAVNTYENASWASKNMTLLGVLIFAFLMLHMGDFWFKIKFTDSIAMVSYPEIDYEVKDLYSRVEAAYENLWIVLAYIIGLVALGFHLVHGFGSAFRTLGLAHKKYTPIIQAIGVGFSILICLGFAVIPLVFYFG